MKPATTLKFAAVLCLAQLFASTTSYAAKVYKWVDDQGVTHFSAIPPDTGKPSETVNIRTGESAADNSEATPVTPQPPAVDTPPPGGDEALNQARRQQDRERCEQARKTHEGLVDMARVRVKDEETGDYRVLSHEEVVAWREEVEAEIRRYCP